MGVFMGVDKVNGVKITIIRERINRMEQLNNFLIDNTFKSL